MPKTMTVAEAAKQLDMTMGWVLTLIHTRKLKAVKVGKLYRVSAESVAARLAQEAQKAGGR
jgi:excisionase family DNA binding protein